jgi:uncharacterized tellurite resistance protein B-like protein
LGEDLVLRRIKSFFDEHMMPVPAADARDPGHALHLAIGALLLEMPNMDGEVWPEQREAVDAALRGHLKLTDAEVAELLELAEAERVESTDYFQFTSLINGAYALEQKIELVELLWRVAYANEALHSHEEYLVRKVADLLYVPHGAFIAAKHRARMPT